MKMAKATEKDIEAAGKMMALLETVHEGYYPSKDEDDEDPIFFDPDDANHLRRFYDEVKASLDESQGWPGRVIGGMCFVILYKENEIIDPDSDVLDLHPKLVAALEKASA